MKAFNFKDVKRRTKQQFLERVGLVAATEDSDFQAEYAEYKGTVNSIRHLQNSMRAHMQATKKQYQAAAAVAVELGAFHRGTPSADGVLALGQIHAELERIQLAAVERLYEEEVISAADLLLWQVPEVEERVKQRKNLLLDLNSHQRKYDTACQALNDVQNQGPNGAGSLLRRGKSEHELTAEVATRKVRLDHAEAAVEEVTEWCLTQFRALLDQRETGKIFAGPMAAFLACERKLTSSASSKFDRIKLLFPLTEKFDETLNAYENEFAKSQAETGDLFAKFRLDDITEREDNFSFGVPLTMQCPQVVTDAIEYLDTKLNVEGLFRIGGSQDVVQELRERYNSGESGCLDGCDPHDVAALLKRFLLDLPESLIPQSFYPRIVAAVNESEPEDAIAEVVGELPEPHIICLSNLLQFLYRIARRSDVNKMSFSNLATCLAPTIVRAPEDESPVKIMKEMQNVILAFKILIEQAKRFDLDKSQNIPPVAPSSSTNLPPRPVSKAYHSSSQMQPMPQASQVSRSSCRLSRREIPRESSQVW